MAALWIIGCIGILLLLLLSLRVGAQISFGEELRVTAKIGPVKIKLLPTGGKDKKKEEAKKKAAHPKERKKAKKDKPKRSAAAEILKGADWGEIKKTAPFFWGILKKTLRRTRRRVLISPMDVSVTFGGDDPAKIAQWYGAAGTALWTLMPQLERLMRIRHPHIHLGVDFQRERTEAAGTLGVSLLVWDMLVIGLGAGIPVLKWYKHTKKEEEKQAKQTPPEQEKKVA